MKFMTKAHTVLFAALLLTAALFSTVSPTQAVTPMIVTTLTDFPISHPDLQDGQCSLREATFNVNKTNNNIYPDCPAGNGQAVITFSSAGTITVDSQINLSDSVTIEGPIILSGGGSERIFRMNPGVSLTLINVTMQDGFTSGAGAAILGSNNTSLKVMTSSFQNNTAGFGGALGLITNVEIIGSTFAGNQAANDDGIGDGGAIYATRQLEISGTNFSGNISKDSGGAVYYKGAGNGAVFNVSDSVFSGNIANGDADNYNAGGGAIAHRQGGESTFERVAFNGNLAPNGGGGAMYFAFGSKPTIKDSAFNGNISGDFDTNGRGGAIYTIDQLTVQRSTFNGNIASGQGEGGAIFHDQKQFMVIANSSFFANSAVGGKGGGIYIADDNPFSYPPHALFNVTLSDNTAFDGGALHVEGIGELELSNTIVSEGSGTGGTCSGDEPVNLTSNLQFPGNDCGSGIPTADPQLGNPAFNGGSIGSLLTQKPNKNSPAIDAGNNTVCLTPIVDNEDQRGESRPEDGDGDGTAACDIGAVETEGLVAGFGSTPYPPGPINVGSAVVGNSTSTTIDLFETGNKEVVLSNPVLGGPQAADFTLNTAFPITIQDFDPSVPLSLTCQPAAVGQRSGTLTFATTDPSQPTVTYNLTCTGVAAPQAGFAAAPAPPGPLDFGVTLINTAVTRDIVIQEVGSATLTVSGGGLSGPNAADFTLVTALPISIINGGADRTLTVNCQPSAAGLRTATLSLTTNDPGQTSLSYALSCEGVKPPEASLVPGTPQTGIGSPYGLDLSPDGRHLYVTQDDPGDRVFVYGRNPDTQALSPIMNITNVEMGGPRGLTVSPDGQFIYVANAVKDNVTVFKRNAANGQISSFQAIEEGDPYLCITIPGNPPCLIDGLDGATDVATSPDGKHLYVASVVDDAVVVLYRGSTNDELGPRQTIKNGNGITGLDGVRSVAVSPDGQHVYVASNGPGTADFVVVFARNNQTGRLTFVTAYNRLTVGRAPRYLSGASDVTLSPDGSFVYVTALNDDAVVAFRRNVVSGELTVLANYRNGFNGLTGMNGARGVAISPDGLNAYVSSAFDGLTIFNRNPGTGQLIFQVSYLDGVDVAFLDGAFMPVVAPDNQGVYVTATGDNAVVPFREANPSPVLLNMLPTSAEAGSGPVEITLTGEDFITASAARWNGTLLPTTFVNGSELRATVSAGLLTSAGTRTVTVDNPGPGGGISDGLTFTISAVNTNPVPAVAELTPPSIPVGTPNLTLTIKGTQFMATSQVKWNGQTRPATFVNSETLQLSLNAADLSGVGGNTVSVTNPGPGGGDSNVVSFEVLAPNENPLPVLSAVSPAAVTAGDEPFTLVVQGSSFLPDSTVRFDGVDQTTNYVSGSELHVPVSAAAILEAGTIDVKVFNPQPGGGSSNTAGLAVAGLDPAEVPYISQALLLPQGSGYAIQLDGLNFRPDSIVLINGQPRSATFVNSARLTYTVASGDFSNGGSAIQVVNPAPGGQSNMLFFLSQQIFLPTALR